MKYALVNPHWSFEGSTYFGCPEPHFPLELLVGAADAARSGHEVLLIDAFMESSHPEQVRGIGWNRFDEDFLVVPTAPSYLFWSCPQPDFACRNSGLQRSSDDPRRSLLDRMDRRLRRPALDKTGADVVLRGEPDQTLPQLAHPPLGDD